MERHPVTEVFILLSLLTAAAGLSACNTTEGVGEDIEAGGEAIDEAAEDAAD